MCFAAIEHFATQGDGNNFFYVGRETSTGRVARVTHHGSRKPGAVVFKAGMDTAERFRGVLSPETPAGHEGELRPPASVLAQFAENPYLKPLVCAPETILHSPIGAACGRVR